MLNSTFFVGSLHKSIINNFKLCKIVKISKPKQIPLMQEGNE